MTHTKILIYKLCYLNIINLSYQLLLGLSHNVILEKFGEIFFEYCQNSGYEKMLDSLGSNLKDFFNSLDALHEHLLYIFPGIRAPSFNAKDSPDGSGIEIYYYSERSGLEYMVVGVVKAVAREVYNVKVNVEVAVSTNQEKTWSKIVVTPENYEDIMQLKQHDEQIQKMQSEDKGEVTVQVKVTDAQEIEPVICEMIWAWVPKSRKS